MARALVVAAAISHGIMCGLLNHGWALLLGCVVKEQARGLLPFKDHLLSIFSISLASTFVCEGISWLLIYRTLNYKSLCSTIVETSKKLETLKTSAPSTNKSKTKKKDRFETSLKESSRDLSFSKFKSGGVVAIVLIIVFGLLNSLFKGKVVAKLPFTLIPFI